MGLVAVLRDKASSASSIRATRQARNSETEPNVDSMEGAEP